MKYYETAFMSVLLVMMTAVSANSDILMLYFQSVKVEMDTEYLIAHHVGNRPDYANDIEDQVHGGDNPNGIDSSTDPNGDNPPDPKGRPDRQDDNDSDTKKGPEAT